MNEKKIEFSLYSQDIIDSSPIIIENDNGVEQSVKSLYLGSISFIQPCLTCGLTEECYGHNGKFKIIAPFFKIAFKKEISFILKNICPKCGSIKNELISNLLTDILNNNNIITLEHKETLNNILLHSKVFNRQIKTKCKNTFCQYQSSSIQYNTKTSSFVYNTNVKNVECDMFVIYKYFKNLPTNFLKLITPANAHNIISPENVFYVNNIMIPSNYIRQPNIHENISFDALTSDLNNLVKNIKFDSNGYKKSQNILDNIDSNQISNPYSINSKIKISTLTNGTSKDSYLRKQINGKRVINTGRAVIGPGKNLKIGEINIPKNILDTMRHVNFFNKVTEKYILKNMNEFETFLKVNHEKMIPYKIINLKDVYKILAPKYGDQFERKLKYGDFICFGRQPSIHPWNFQASEIKKFNSISPDKIERTIKIPTDIAASFNADFDGDEMLTQKFSNSTANIEMGLVMNSKMLLKHPVTGTTMFGFVQDQIVGANYLLQQENISKEKAYLILGKYSYLLQKYESQEIYTGRDIISLIFPENFTFGEIFKNGKIICENITVQMVAGNSYNSIFNALSQIYDEHITLSIISIFKKIIQNFLKYYSLSIKMTDIVPNLEMLTFIEEKVNEFVTKINNKINELIKDINDNKIFISSYDEITNLKIKNIDKMNKEFQIIVKDLIAKYYNSNDNIFYLCYKMGYKLSINDFISILCYVGQKNNKEINYPKVNGKTTLFGLQNDISIETSGFIKNSFIKGVTFNEFVTMVKEESLPQIVNVTSGTSQAGYAGKKIIRIASELILNYDRFIVSNKNIINFNPNFLKISCGDMNKIKIILPNKKLIWYKELDKIFKEKIKDYILVKYDKSNLITQVDFYIDLPSMIKIYYYKNKNEEISINHENNFKKIHSFYNMIKEKYYFNLNDISYVLYILLLYFDPSGYVFNDKNINLYFSNQLLDDVFEKILFKLNYSLNPGSLFGYQIAHTLQERFTQQTLSSFHSTTKAGSNVQKGATDEFKQLLELSKKDKEDIITCESYDYNFLLDIKNKFEHISFKFICENIILLEENKNLQTVLYRCDISMPILIQKNIDICLIYKMVKKYCDRCFSIQEYFTYINFPQKKDDKYIKIYIFAQLKTFVKKTQVNFDILKYYFKVSLLDGIHKGKQINTNLEIEEIDNLVFKEDSEDYELENKKLYRLKFFIENSFDMQYIKTSKLENIYVQAWISNSIGGINYMKINTIGKVNNLINDITFTHCLKHFFDFRFAYTKPTNIKTLYNKSEIIKQANNGNNNIIVKAAYNNQTDPCNDIYSSMFVGQKSKIGTNYYGFYLNPNQFNKFKIIEKQELLIDDDEKIFSII